MRTIPTAITDGFTNNLQPFWLVVIRASTVYYWPTIGKNLAGNALIIKETSGGAAVTYDSDVIADEVDNSQIDGLGDVETECGLLDGGGVGSIGEFNIEILNQDRFDQAVTAAEVNLENVAVELYFGFVPSGATPTVVIADDMLKLWSGVIDEPDDFDYRTAQLKCIDGSFQKHKEIPTTVLDEDNHPNAPPENWGKPIPIVYGTFYEAAATLEPGFSMAEEEREWDFMDICPVPAIKTKDVEEEFVIADHAIHTLKSIWVYGGGDNRIYGKLFAYGAGYGTGYQYGGTPAPTTSNITGPSVFTIVGDYVAFFRQVPKARGTQSDASITAIILRDSIDDSLITGLTLTGTKRAAYILKRPAGVGEFVTTDPNTGDGRFVRVWIFNGAISGTVSITWEYFDGATITFLDGYPVGTLNKSDNLGNLTLTLEQLGKFEFIIRKSFAPESDIGLVHVFYEYAMRVQRQGIR